jgi:hypothetical protein
MNDPRNLLGLAPVGNRRLPRYAVVKRRGSSEPVRYWTGNSLEPWSQDPRKATRWADPEVAAVALNETPPDADRDPEIGVG